MGVRALRTMLYPLNRSEQAYLALDGLAGSIIQPYLMRLNAPLDAERVRQAARRLVTAYDRLRAVVVPGRHLYAFRVLPDDVLMDQLFELAWRVVPDVDAGDPAQVEAWHNRLLNEVVSLERGLGLRVYYVPHAHSPLLVLSVHHVLLDGRSMLHAIGDLLQLLNGGVIENKPMEAPSLVAAIAPREWRDWPRRLWASFKQGRAVMRELNSVTLARVPGQRAHHYSANAVLHHELPVSAEEIRAAAKRHKTTVNTLMLAALVEAVRAMQADPQGDSAVVVRLSVDLRRFFPRQDMPVVGNFVGSFTVCAKGPMALPARVTQLDRQAKDGLARFVRREMSLGYLLEESFTWLGRTLFAHVLQKALRSDRLVKTSCHLSTLGALDDLNAKGAEIRVTAMYPTAASMLTVLVGTIEMGGRMLITVSWQLSERERAVIDALMVRFDEIVHNLTDVR